VQFVELLQHTIAFAGNRPARVLVLSIPDWGVTPFAQGRDRAAISSAIDRFNAISRAEAERLTLRYLDITPISRQPHPALIAADGLHPSGSMYAQWATLALPIVRAMLA
jgi:lysophospholipase L1-like esterase